MRHLGYLKAYVQEFNTKMNGATKIDKLAKEFVVVDGILKVVVGCLVRIPKAHWGHRKDIQNS